MKTKYLFGIIAIMFLLQACDKIEEPYIKEGNVIWNGRKIIIYDFTGHKCGNCPRAQETIKSLIGIYGEAIVPIAFHSTSFARTTSNDTSQPYHYDFRTEIGDFLGGRMTEPGFYGELALPIGLVNNLAPESLKAHTAWGTEVAKIISSFPEFNIQINAEYLSSDSTINAEIDVVTNINNSRSFSLTVFILEDYIINWQTDYSLTPRDIPDYEHNHVFRTGMNGTFGENIKSNTNASVLGDKISKTYSTKAGSDWVINNCLVVAFVYDNQTKEVLQAEVIHLSE